MTADYPGAVRTFRTVENLAGITFDDTKTRQLFAEDIIFADEEITAIETVLGINPQGATTDVAQRLTDIESAITNIITGYTILDALTVMDIGGMTTASLAIFFAVVDGLYRSPYLNFIDEGGNFTNLHTSSAGATNNDVYLPSTSGQLLTAGDLNPNLNYVNTYAPATGGNVNPTIGATLYATIFVQPAGAIANVTLTLPALGTAGQLLRFSFSQAVTTITYAGQAQAGGPATVVANSGFSFVADIATSKWRLV